MSEAAAREKVVDFYDKYVPRQARASFNARHTKIMAALKPYLRPDSTVLELGCGVGVMTPVIAAHVHEGLVLASDISPASVEAARASCVAPNVRFDVSGVAPVTFPSPSAAPPLDVVTLFDVIEHVPLADHGRMLESIAQHMHDTSVIVIHIPNPALSEWLIENQPEKMQVIDQAVWADALLAAAYGAGLVLKQFRTWDIWAKEDYQWMVFAKRVARASADG